MLGAAEVALAQEEGGPPATLRNYSDMQVHPEEGDCLGITFQLYEAGEQLLGELQIFEGNCDPFVFQIIESEYDAESGLIRLVTAPGDQKDFPYRYEFTGILQPDLLTGYVELIHSETGNSSGKHKHTLNWQE